MSPVFGNSGIVDQHIAVLKSIVKGTHKKQPTSFYPGQKSADIKPCWHSKFRQKEQLMR